MFTDPRIRRNLGGILLAGYLAAALAFGAAMPTAAAAVRAHAGAARPAATASSSYGACQISGTAKFTPGLSTTSRTVKYTFKGKFTNCQGSNSKITSGTVTASGKGTEACSSGTTKGTATIRWNNGQTSTIAISTNGVGNAVEVSGTVTKGTAFKGDTATAVLAFTANPTSCTGSGVTSAPFNGAGEIS